MFRRYVSTKGNRHENNVLFWQEAEKYKVSVLKCCYYTHNTNDNGCRETFQIENKKTHLYENICKMYAKIDKKIVVFI